MLATEHFVAHILKYLTPDFGFREACMMLLFRSFVQFDAEPLIACMMLLFRSFVQFDVEPLIAYCNSLNSLEQLPVYFYLITRIIQFDCLDRSLYSQGKMCDKTWLKI